MNYSESLAYLASTRILGSRLGLENIGILLKYLDDPQKDLSFIHVTGTNGKGSTIAFLHSILSQTYTIGTFTSPAIDLINEQIRINDSIISDIDFARIATQVAQKREQMILDGHAAPTEFECMTTMAFLYFKENQCDLCLLEVGMGGDTDATNIIDTSVLSIITSISLDHADYLGHTLKEITDHKAGIIKENGHVLTYPQEKEVMKVLTHVCDEKKACLYIPDLKPELTGHSLDHLTFSYRNFTNCSIHLTGLYQMYNASLAIEACFILRQLGWPVSDTQIRTGLQITRWTGRFEVIRKDPLILVDGSHNSQGALKLADTLSIHFPDQKVILVIGVLKDKDYETMTDCLVPHAKSIYTISVPNPRSLSAVELKKVLEKKTTVDIYACNSLEQAVNLALGAAAKEDVILFCGSLYSIGQIKTLLLR